MQRDHIFGSSLGFKSTRLHHASGKSGECRSNKQFPNTKTSISVRKKQEIASSGKRTTGSFSLSEGFNTIGTPVFSKNFEIRAWHLAFVPFETDCLTTFYIRSTQSDRGDTAEAQHHDDSPALRRVARGFLDAKLLRRFLHLSWAVPESNRAEITILQRRPKFDFHHVIAREALAPPHDCGCMPATTCNAGTSTLGALTPRRGDMADWAQ